MSESSAVYPRPVLNRLPAYAAGKPPAATPGLTPFKLSSNENPYGPVPAVSDAIRKYADSGMACRYPDTIATQLAETISERFNTPAEDIVFGTGSYGALTQIVSAFAGTNDDGTQDEVIFAWRSFEAYPIVVRTAGARDVQVPLTAQHRHDLSAMADAITDRTRVILLCTPNNPTGPILTTAEVEDFLAKVPRDVVVVIDEAYLEFVRDDAAVDGVSMVQKHPNVIALRTFSKAHGLANLRIGYSISHPEITQYLRVMQVPFATSTLAQHAALTSLQHMDEVNERVELVVQERNRVVAALHEMGFDVPETHANFVWLPLGERTPELIESANAQALALRGFGTEGARVTIGEKDANDRFLKLMQDFGAREASSVQTSPAPAGQGRNA